MATDKTPENPPPANEEDNEQELDKLQVLPLVALRDTVIFPEMIVPLQVGRERSVKALDRAVRTSQPVALVTQRSSEQEDIGSVDELYTIGTLAKIAQVIRLQDGTIRAIVQGRRRIRLLDLLQTDPTSRLASRSLTMRPRRRSRSRRSWPRSTVRSSSTSTPAHPCPPRLPWRRGTSATAACSRT